MAPFNSPDLLWDFRLPRVKSINTSGHKYGGVLPGVGWVLWREQAALPEELRFNVNYLGGQMEGEGRVAIHFMHRMGAIVVALYLGYLISRMYKYAGGHAMRGHAHLMLALLVIQLGLGLSNIIWSLPLWVAVAHNAGGALLLLSLVTLNYRLFRSSAW